MDLNLIANLEDIPAVQSYLNDNSSLIDYNSPLYEAQKEQMAYMTMKQRKPMVVEYYDTPGNPKSIEMYINPERLVMQTQKLKTKQITRGGIFYHHYGDDHWAMQLSGSVGLSGMRGIEQLEDIYYHSGTLLRYTDVGPDKVASSHMPATYDQINLQDDPVSGLQYLLDNDISESSLDYIYARYNEKVNNYNNPNPDSNMQRLNSQRKFLEICGKLVAGLSTVVNIATTTAAFNRLYTDLNTYIAQNKSNGRYMDLKTIYQECQRRVIQSLPDVHPELQVSIANDLANTLNSYQSNPQFDIAVLDSHKSLNDNMKLLASAAYSYVGDSDNVNLYSGNTNNAYHETGQLRSEALSNYINEVREFNQNNKINRDDASRGWVDIQDEIDDPWRPRQIFIYFEDRVYIGHFDSFSWQREAGVPLIRYDMRFTVTRQVIITSTSGKTAPTIPASQPAKYSTTEKVLASNSNNWDDKLKYFGTKSAKAIEDAKNEILRIKEAFVIERDFDVLNGQTTSAQRIVEVNKSLSQIREIIGVSESDPLYGNRELDWSSRFAYYKQYKTNADALNAAKTEFAYLKALIINKLNSGMLDLQTEKNILGRMNDVYTATSITEIKTFVDTFNVSKA